MTSQDPNAAPPPELPADQTATFESRRGDSPIGSGDLSASMATVSFWRLEDESQTPRTRAGEPTAGAEAPPDLPTQPAAYALQRMVGRGGFGEVWEAVQVSLGRSVAVKRIRADVRTSQGFSDLEFRNEALTTAALEHPNIVPVHDLGRDEEGRPVIAMKLVRGRPWSAVLEEDFRALAPADFLARHVPTLLATAQAVAFAHSKGVLHRDLKPSQVMTGEFGEVLLMDWGLAVGFAEEGDAPAGAGGFRLPSRRDASSPSGTPAYMAPEQTTRTADGLGPWTDVWLLGAILYQLLTGVPPHAAATSLAAFQRAAEGVVMPPSQRAPDRPIPAELEAICLRALSLKPADRHPSVARFVEEVRDYLSGSARRRESETLVAQSRADLARARGVYVELARALEGVGRARALWPENRGAAELEQDILAAYADAALNAGDLKLARVQAERLAPGARRTGLLAACEEGERRALNQQRQRRFATAAAFALLALILVGSLVFTNRIASERDQAERARAEAERARVLESAARRDADLQREKAVAARNDSEGLVAFMLTELRTRLAPRDPQLELLDGLSNKALAYFDARDTTTMSMVELRQHLRGMVELTRVMQEQTHPEMGSLAKRMGALAERLERDPEAREMARRARSLANGTAAKALHNAGRAGDAAEIMRKEVATSLTELQAGDASSFTVEDAYASVSALMAYLSSISTDEVLAMKPTLEVLAAAAERTGTTPERRASFAASTTAILAQALERGGDAKAAREELRRARDLARIAVRSGDLQASMTLALMNYRLASSLLREMDKQQIAAIPTTHQVEAEEAYLESVSAGESAVEAKPDMIEARQTLTLALDGISTFHSFRGDYPESVRARQRQMTLMEDLVRRDPGNVRWLNDMGQAYLALGETHTQAGDAAASEAALDQATAILQRALRLAPSDRMTQRRLAGIAQARAVAAMRRGDSEAMLPHLKVIIEGLETIRRAEPDNVDNTQQLANSYANLADTYRVLGRYRDQLPASRTEYELNREIKERSRTRLADPPAYTGSLYGLTEVLLRLGDYAEARRINQEAIDHFRAVGAGPENQAQFNRRLGQHLVLRGRIEKAAGAGGYVEYLDEADKLLTPLSKGFFVDPLVLGSLAWSAHTRGDMEKAKAFARRIPRERLEADLAEAVGMAEPTPQPTATP